MTPTEILDAVCEAFGVLRMDLLSARRHRHLADARTAACKILTEVSPLSYPRIGHLLCRDHTTIMHHIKRFEKRLEDPIFRECFAAARDGVNGEVEIPRTEYEKLQRTVEAMRAEIAALRAGTKTLVVYRTIREGSKVRPPTMAELIADQERETREKLHG